MSTTGGADHIDLSEVKKGDSIIEYDNDLEMSISMKALEDARKTDRGIECFALTDTGEKVRLFYAYGYAHYGPKLLLTARTQ